jgi:hypothetical protein
MKGFRVKVFSYFIFASSGWVADGWGLSDLCIGGD